MHFSSLEDFSFTEVVDNGTFHIWRAQLPCGHYVEISCDGRTYYSQLLRPAFINKRITGDVSPEEADEVETSWFKNSIRETFSYADTKVDILEHANKLATEQMLKQLLTGN